MASWPRRRWGRWLVGLGAVACIPGGIAVIVFAQGVAVLDAFQAARPCEIPTLNDQASCLSLFNGTITEHSSAGKNNSRLKVAVGHATTTVTYTTPNRASFDPGSEVITEWWKGQLVLLGPPGAPPTTITDQNPLQHLETFSFVLGLVIPGVSLLAAGLLMLQAPMSADELIKTTLARWPDPPRPVDRVIAWRVAWGGYGALVALFVWMTLYVFPGMIFVLATNQPRYAPWLLVATFAISFGLMVVLSAGNLLYLSSSAARRTIVVQNLQRGLGRHRNETKIWYELTDGKVASMSLDRAWDGRVNQGDRFDVLAIPKSGEFLRMISTPPASTNGQG
jgi:hypothetical protein